jgi:hypothetical protein
MIDLCNNCRRETEVEIFNIPEFKYEKTSSCPRYLGLRSVNVCEKCRKLSGAPIQIVDGEVAYKKEQDTSQMGLHMQYRFLHQRS